MVESVLLLASWDRASMSLPAKSKLRNGSGKSAVMDLFYRYFNAVMLEVINAPTSAAVTQLR